MRAIGPHESAAAVLITRSIELELRARQVYVDLAARFADDAPAAAFFTELAAQEQSHADLLAVCRAALDAPTPGGNLAHWREVLPRLNRRMDEIEAMLATLDTLPAAMELVFRLESSEINHAFAGLVAEVDAPLVRAVRAFHDAGRDHLAFIAENVSHFRPDLAMACRSMHVG